MSQNPVLAAWKSVRAASKKHITPILYVLGAIASVVAAIGIGLLFHPDKDTLQYELWTLAIQALLIGALGGLLGAAIQDNRSRREALETKSEADRERCSMLRDFQRERLTTAMNDLALEYRLIKRSRRMLRLEQPVGWRLYCKELARLEDLQRSLEDSQGTLEVLAATSSLPLQQANDNVQGMITVLDELWKERESSAGREKAEFDATAKTYLRNFIISISEKNSSFLPMKELYKSARKEILDVLAELSGADRNHSKPANGGVMHVT